MDEVYDDSNDRYHTDLDALCEYYWDDSIKVEDVPEFYYECKPYEVTSSQIDGHVQNLIDNIQEDIQELNYEEEYFSERVTDIEFNELVGMVRGWINKVSNTIIPDYDKKHPLRDYYKEYCEDQQFPDEV